MLLSKRRNRERQNENWEQNRKWIIGLRFKFSFVLLFHFLVPVRACFPNIQDYLILLTFFSHFVCTYNTCTICRRRIPVGEFPSTLFQGCFITKTSEVSEPHWDIRRTKNSVSWKRGWMIPQLSARDCGVFNVPSWCINCTPRSSVMNLYSSHIWWVWPS